MKIEQFLIGILLVCLVMFGGFWIMGGVNNQYGTTIGEDSNFNKSMYDRMNEINTVIDPMNNNTFEGGIDPNDAQNDMVKKSYNTMRLTKLLFALPVAFMSQMAYYLGIPTWMIAFGVGIMIILVVFTIAYIFLRFRST